MQLLLVTGPVQAPVLHLKLQPELPASQQQQQQQQEQGCTGAGQQQS
jgi:hypothetical protein